MSAFVAATPRTLRTAAILFAAALSASSCVFGKKASDSGAVSWNGEIPLQVVNHHWLDVTIYVIHGGQRTRVGVAGGSAQTRMMLPWRLLSLGGELRLYGDPIGSPELAITEVIVVQPGQSVEWLLESGLERSTVSVY